MPPKFAAPKKGKQPKETVVYPASKRKAPPFKPQRPGNAKASKASESSAAADVRSRPASGELSAARAIVDDVEEAEGDEDREQAEGGTAGSAQAGASEGEGEGEGAGDDESEEELAADPLAAQPKAPLRSQAKATRPPAKKPSSASTTARRQTTRPRSSMSISDDDDNHNNNNKDTTHRAPLSSPPPPPPQPTPSSEIPRIPQPLLLRLLHEAFRDKQTRIDTHALQVLEKYLEVFVREAVARTALRKQEAAARGEVPASEARWLELEDLEKVAPGLVMDF